MKVGIYYEYTRKGRKEQAEVSVEAPSKAAATNKFTNQFAGRYDKILSTREIVKPPRV